MKYFLLIGFLFFGLNFSHGQIIDSLLTVLNSPSTPDTNKIKILSRLSYETRFNDHSQSMDYAFQGLEIAEKLDLPKFIHMHQLNISDILIEQSQFDKVDSVLQLVESSAEEINDLQALAGVYYNQGYSAERQGFLKEAIELNLKTVRIYEEMNDLKMIGAAYEGVGLVYMGLEDWGNAIKYIRLSKKYFEEADIPPGVASSSLNIAGIYSEQGQLDSALIYYQEGYDVASSINSIRHMAWNMQGLAMTNFQLGRAELAEIQIGQALGYFQEIGDQDGISGIHISSGDIAFENGEFSKAERHFLEAYMLSSEIGVLSLQIYALEKLSEVNKNMNNFEKAFEYLTQSKLLNDSLINVNNKQAIADLEIQYQTEKKDNQIRVQTLELKNASDRNRILVLGISLIGVLVLVIWLFYYYRLKAKSAEKKLQAAEHESEKQQLLLNSKQEAFKAYSEGQEVERKRMAEELHDDIGATLSGIQHQLQSYSTTGEHSDLSTPLGHLNKITGRVRNLSHQLMPPLVSSSSLNTIIEDYLEDFGYMKEEKVTYHYFNNESSPALTDMQKLHIFRITQECLQNISKHADAKNIQVQVSHWEDSINLIIEDDGKGMDLENDANEGIGLRNIRSRVNLIGGIVDIDSNPGHGTIVNISVPL